MPRLHRHATRSAVAVLLVSAAARADPAPAPMPTPIDGLGTDIALAFSGYNLLFYGGAVAATGIMSFGGADHAVRVAVQEHLAAPAYADVALYSGYIVPLAIAPTLYVVGLALHDPRTAGGGSAAVQAFALTLATTSILKVGVGRVFPLNGGDPNAIDRLNHPDYAQEFHPFHRLWPLPAWPSGHISVSISIAAALSAYYPEEVWLPLVGYPIALGIGFGMVVGDNHWASDVIAGGLIGHAIGSSVGRAFRRRFMGGGDTGSFAFGLDVVPILGPGFEGVGLARTW